MQLKEINYLKKEIELILANNKALDIRSINLKNKTTIADFMIIASATSTRQTKALARNVKEEMKQLDVKVIGIEGEKEGDWVLVDLGDIIVHIMTPTTRAYFNLEELWTDK